MIHLNSKNIKSGFSLLELSMTVLILSIVSVVFTTFYGYTSEKLKKIETEEKIETIESALADYFSENGRMPCVAGLKLYKTDIEFGSENCTVSQLEDKGIYIDSSGAATLVYGAVPVVELGLDSDYAYDEWGNSFSYIIDSTFYDPANFQDQDSINIVLSSYGGIPLNAMFVLISHGKNGRGAFNQGYQNPLPKTAGAGPLAERENVIIEVNNPAFNDSFKMDLYEDDFDDIVLFKTKHQLIVDAYW